MINLVDTSAKAVERLAFNHIAWAAYRPFCGAPPATVQHMEVAATLRALLAERDAALRALEAKECAAQDALEQAWVERDAAEADADGWRHECERLRLGGCARGQTTPQWCAEAVQMMAERDAALAQVAASEAKMVAMIDAREGARAKPFQKRVEDWIHHCFGPAIGADKVERNHRFIEEALELVQAGGCTASEAHQLVDYVFGRPVGEITQEVGGVMNTLAALCNANGVDLADAAETELRRVWGKSDVIRAKQAAKPKHSPLPAAPALTPETPPFSWEKAWDRLAGHAGHTVAELFERERSAVSRVHALEQRVAALEERMRNR